VKVLWCTSEQSDLWSGSWRTSIPVRSCKIVKWACCCLPPPMATMPIQSCGALVNNRTSGLVPECLRFSRSDCRLWYKIVKWACCCLPHPMATMQTCPPAYDTCLSRIQQSPSGSFPVTLTSSGGKLWSELDEVGPLPWLPPPPCRTHPFRPHPCRQRLFWQCQPACETRWSRPQLSPSARLVPETLWKNKQTNKQSI